MACIRDSRANPFVADEDVGVARTVDMVYVGHVDVAYVFVIFCQANRQLYVPGTDDGVLHPLVPVCLRHKVLGAAEHVPSLLVLLLYRPQCHLHAFQHHNSVV